MEADPLQLGRYIGTMLVTRLIMGALMLVMLRKPQLLSHRDPPVRSDLAPALANCILFALALLLALAMPGVQFWGLLALSLSSPLERLLRARLA